MLCSDVWGSIFRITSRDRTQSLEQASKHNSLPHNLLIARLNFHLLVLFCIINMSEFSPGKWMEDPKVIRRIEYAEGKLLAAAAAAAAAGDGQRSHMPTRIEVSDLFVPENFDKALPDKQQRPQIAMKNNRIVRDFVFPLFNLSELIKKPVKNVDKLR
jgi:hypothetical protein